MKSREEIVQYIFSLNARHIKYDLGRMVEACRRLGDPQRAIQCVHVAGTNGKGSTCAMIASCLRQAGRRVGLYTSPHLVDFEERYIMDGRVVATDAWVDVYARVEPLIEDLKLTFFEIGTLIAFELFKREKVDWAVYETGLGGRLDATNVAVPKVSVITSISMDHMDYLGDDLDSIAREKLGIVKQGVPLVMARPESSDLLETAREVCAAKAADLELVDAGQARDTQDDESGTSFVFQDRTLRVPLRGRYQALNALCALAACRRAGVSDPAVLAAGLAATWVPARFQVVAVRGKTVVFDVAHNPGAAEALASALRQRFPGTHACVVAGIMADKDAKGVLEQLNRAAGRFVLTQPQTPRACAARDLPASLPARAAAHSVVPSVGQAVEQALAGEAAVVCITGSFYTVGEAMTHLGIKPYGTHTGG